MWCGGHGYSFSTLIGGRGGGGGGRQPAETGRECEQDTALWVLGKSR